jgi:hypothetical protein
VPGPLPHDHPAGIGPYRILDRLGEGGMGTVYLGEDGSGGKVAIKVIRREHAADPRYRARFEAEVAAAQRVRPFCTAPVLDADPHADPPYLVTEYVRGSSLQDASPLRGADLEALAVGMASALTAIHDAGVVHRDLKPANVLLSPYGPRVIDFGIARGVDATRLTATGGLVGTPAFMSPEQLEGRDVTPASDVFAWGATLAFAASGTPCFDGPTLPAIIHRILTAEPNLRGLQGTLLSAVRAALAKSPESRPTAQQLLGRLVSSHSPPNAPAPASRHATQAPPEQPPTSPGFGQVVPAPLGPPAVHAQQPLPPPAMGSDESAALVEQHYRLAAEAGDTASMYNLGVLLNWRGQTAEAEYWYRRAAAAQTYPRGSQYQTTMHTMHPTAHRPPEARYNTAAVYALVFGLVGLVTCGLPSIPAMIAGHIGWAKVKRTGERGAGLAAAGIALGWIMVAFWALIAFGLLLGEEGGSGEY